MQFLVYLFWPNPGSASYDNPKVIALLAFCTFLIVLSFALRMWRKRQQNTVLRRLSRSWAAASFWFGVIGLVLAVSRVELIQYIAMRVWWFLWLLSGIAYIAMQIKLYRMRYYEVLPSMRINDPREKYLPHAKKK